MRQDLSRAIYRQLINGNVINKQMLDGSLLVPNPLFDELASDENREHYDHLYSYIGYELKQLGDSFFLNEIGKDDVLSEVAMKVQTLLVVLTRGVADRHLYTGILTDLRGGLTRQQIDEMGDQEENQQILAAVGFKGRLIVEVQNVLVTRQLAFWNGQDHLVLSDGGKGFLDHLHGV
ncbi:condensin complex protein MksE [Parendozoicomonas haliclonae]|uniref:Uncharacterized protein n=1 Tax=Parendozoicomonas haliclonae TaxID=1960125 RepID=A0A1X7AM51_9GAMM|nr:hypothetical protein [Parendozoicomonas haliclonae]SMA49216.1 hypothetical protein EHSB41UT_03120 [Parendozoicomonas haliclonae]